jgi:hypothetical protein
MHVSIDRGFMTRRSGVACGGRTCYEPCAGSTSEESGVRSSEIVKDVEADFQNLLVLFGLLLDVTDL